MPVPFKIKINKVKSRVKINKNVTFLRNKKLTLWNVYALSDALPPKELRQSFPDILNVLFVQRTRIVAIFRSLIFLLDSSVASSCV